MVQHSPIIGADATCVLQAVESTPVHMVPARSLHSLVHLECRELFEHWWAWAQLPSRSTSPAGAPALESVFVPSLQQNITVPCWSAAVAETKRCANPLHGAEGLPPKTPHNSSTPMQLRLNDSEAAVFLSGSPPEILADGGAAAYGKQRSDQLHQPSRTYVATHCSVTRSVWLLCIKNRLTPSTDTNSTQVGSRRLGRHHSKCEHWRQCLPLGDGLPPVFSIQSPAGSCVVASTKRCLDHCSCLKGCARNF